MSRKEILAMTTPRPDLATKFHRLHEGQALLVIANAWDAGSARMIESLGAPAAATTSAGVAWSLGYPDGEALPFPLLVSTIAGIVRAIDVPLTVDLEGGYADDPEIVGETVARVIDVGAIGINIEDGSASPDLLCAKIARAKRAGVRLGINLFVNARTDVYLRDLAPKSARVAETLAREERYREAGADGIFVPGLVDPVEIRAIAAGTALPLNVMASRDLPPAAELARLGVRRLSAGSAIAQGVWSRAEALAGAFLAEGRSDRLSDDVMPYGKINELVAERR
jgi:2-methylisocitrate lyase-like PEP mutase family enzyme